MTRSYLSKELELEGVDPLALIDILDGVGHVAQMLAALPDRVRIGIVGHLEQQLKQPDSEVAPLAKFVIDATAHACSNPAYLDKLRAQVSHGIDPDRISAARLRHAQSAGKSALAMALPMQMPGMNHRSEVSRQSRAA